MNRIAAYERFDVGEGGVDASKVGALELPADELETRQDEHELGHGERAARNRANLKRVLEVALEVANALELDTIGGAVLQDDVRALAPNDIDLHAQPLDSVGDVLSAQARSFLFTAVLAHAGQSLSIQTPPIYTATQTALKYAKSHFEFELGRVDHSLGFVHFVGRRLVGKVVEVDLFDLIEYVALHLRIVEVLNFKYLSL